jgi:hypothetical protein
MTESEGQREGVDLTKGTTPPPAADEPFDPYRFGRPEHPIPAEYAPPGYTGPTIPPASRPYGPAGYGAGGDQSYGGPPPTPYGGPPSYGPGQPPRYPDFGAPPPPPYHGYPMPPARSGKAVAALVFGILSIVLCFLSFFDGVFVVLGLVFGVVALNESRTRNAGGRGLAVAGVVCSIIGALLATVLTVLLVHAANQCGGFQNDNSDQWQTCVRNHIF